MQVHAYALVAAVSSNGEFYRVRLGGGKTISIKPQSMFQVWGVDFFITFGEKRAERRSVIDKAASRRRTASRTEGRREVSDVMTPPPPPLLPFPN